MYFSREKNMNIIEQFRLDGKIALVTGAKRGMGKCFAIALAEAGADIIGVSRTLEISGSEVENKISQLGRKFNAFQCDFSNRKQLYEFIKNVKSDFERIDILVNNAGTIHRKSTIEHSDMEWDKLVEVNLTAQFILAREFGKEMIKRGKGKIIFIASLLTFQGGIDVSSYAASKGAIGQLTKSLSNEWASKGVNVNAIAPGYIETDLTSPLLEDKERYNSILNRIPFRRWGKPKDLKGGIVFLASDASDYVNGIILPIDGGWLGR